MGERMKGGTITAGANVRYLEQGIELILRLSDDEFADAPGSPFPGGVGAQLRHCIDFYACFLSALAGGRIDYPRRQRDPRLETDRRHAESRLRELAETLKTFEAETGDRELLVRSEESTGDATEYWTRSTVRRELDFLVSHTIHHYALIVVLLRFHGFEFPAELDGFGVAPSTLRHWRETGTQAP